MSSVFLKKIVKKNKAAADELEQKVAEELYKLETSKGNSISADVAKIYITAAKEVKVEDSKPAIVLFVPFIKQKATQRIQSQLVRELEKKFNGQHVVVIADRTILSKSFARSKKSSSGPRPRSRTLMHVQEKMMDDLVYPTEIVGKRMSYRQDGTKTMKVFLDPSKQMDIETKLDTFAAVYEFLTNKKVEFLFPQKN
jgi:small subunit ribosomal protein S7e